MDVQLDLDVFDVVRDTARKSPGLMNTAARRQQRSLKARILPELRQDPGPPHYPIRWKSKKQRRAFFATNGFGGGIPYQRTGALFAGYDVQIITNDRGGVLQITNRAPHAQYVVGDDAQPFHLDTGFVQVADVVVKYSEIATNEFIEIWWTVADPFAGVSR